MLKQAESQALNAGDLQNLVLSESTYALYANSKATNQKEEELRPNYSEGRKNCILPNGEKATGKIFLPVA